MEHKNNLMSIQVKVGNQVIGGGAPILVQTMCNTHTGDVDASVEQCVRLHRSGAQMIRLTVPSIAQVDSLAQIHSRLRNMGIDTPLVADVHFSSEIAIAAAQVVEKVRINPGNFHKDHQKAREQFARLVAVCKEHGTAIRIGLNHGSLGERITNMYGNTPLAMKEAVMEWLEMCDENGFDNVVVSLKASNTYIMTEAYRLLYKQMQENGLIPVVNRVEIDYLTPLRSDDVMISSLWVELKGVRFIFHQTITNKVTGEIAIKAIVSCVCLENGKLSRGEAFKEAFKDYL